MRSCMYSSRHFSRGPVQSSLNSHVKTQPKRSLRRLEAFSHLGACQNLQYNVVISRIPLTHIYSFISETSTLLKHLEIGSPQIKLAAFHTGSA